MNDHKKGVLVALFQHYINYHLRDMLLLYLDTKHVIISCHLVMILLVKESRAVVKDYILFMVVATLQAKYS